MNENQPRRELLGKLDVALELAKKLKSTIEATFPEAAAEVARQEALSSRKAYLEKAQMGVALAQEQNVLDRIERNLSTDVEAQAAMTDVLKKVMA